MAKSLKQVRDEFSETDEPADWLMLEICEYFTAATHDEQMELLDRIDDDFDFMSTTNFAPGETTCWEMSIYRSGNRVHVTAFSEVPPAMGFLDMLTTACQAGDEVVVVHSRAGLDQAALTSSWPLGMDEALRLTSPDPAEAKTWDEAFDAIESGAV